MHNVDTLNICMKEFGSQKLIFDKMSYENFDNFSGSQLLMDSLNTLLSHYRHIGNLHEEV